MLKKSTRIRLGQLQQSERNLSSTKWRSIACLNELLEEQETAEDGKELKSVTVDGRKDFRRWTVRQWGAARDKGFRRQYWVRVDAGDTWSLRFGGPLPWRRSQSKSNFWRRRRQAKVGHQWQFTKRPGLLLMVQDIKTDQSAPCWENCCNSQFLRSTILKFSGNDQRTL